MISVVIPVYNVEAYLRECVDSVLKQTYQDYEIILVDDGATDRSGAICDQYANEFDKISVIHQENGGLSAARNTGLAATKGEYIYFLDSDDYILPDMLSKLFYFINKNELDAVFFDGEVFFSECKESLDVYRYERSHQYAVANGRKLLTELLKSDEYRTIVQLMFFKKSYLIDNNISFLPGILHEDELFTYQIFWANGRIGHLHEQLYMRRIRPNSIMTSSKMCKRLESYIKIYFELEKLYPSDNIRWECADIYMIRTSKGIIGRFNLLNDSDKQCCITEFDKFKNNVLVHRGYGDWKIQIKCSQGIKKLYFRVRYKICRLFKKDN